MKGKNRICIAAAVTLSLTMVPGGLSAEAQMAAQNDTTKHTHYKVIDLGTFGGPHSSVNGESVDTNAKGTVVGGASTAVPDPACFFDYPYCFAFHAFKYQRHEVIDLGTLPGGTNSFAIAINSRGTVAGISENGLIDQVTGVSEYVATVWKDGQVLNFGTLGGSFSLPNAINDRGQAAGGAENTILDPNNLGGELTGLPSPTQWHAALWKDGIAQDLGTLGTGEDSLALSINGSSQVAGVSYTSSIVNPTTGIPAVDPFFWENGEMVDIGTLGGALGTVGNLNSKGQVVGSSNLAGDLVAHAFLWQRGSLRDLGTLGGTISGASWIDDSGGIVGGATTNNDETLRAFRWKNGRMTNLGSLNGDICSVAFAGNSKGQVVGDSLSDCDVQPHPFLWEGDGPMVDLNTFLPNGSGILLRGAEFINEQGEITVSGRLANGDNHAFVLIPDGESNLVDLETVVPVVDHSPVTAIKVAVYAARFAHTSRSFGPRQSIR